MSRIKDYLIDLQNRPGAAEQILVEAGCLERCERCEEVRDPHPIGCDLEKAYKIAGKKHSAKDPLVECFRGDFRALTDLIKQIYAECPKECLCERRLTEE